MPTPTLSQTDTLPQQVAWRLFLTVHALATRRIDGELLAAGVLSFDDYDVLLTVNEAADGVSFDSPEGKVTVNGENHHIAKTGLIGQINAENQFDIVWSSEEPIEPDPFLEGYDWWDPNAE